MKLNYPRQFFRKIRYKSSFFGSLGEIYNQFARLIATISQAKVALNPKQLKGLGLFRLFGAGLIMHISIKLR